LIFVRVAQDAFEISAAIEDTYDNDFAVHDPERNRCAPLKSNGPQSRPNVVTAGAARRRSFQRHAGCLDSVDVPSGNYMTGSLGNIAVKSEQIGLSLGSKYDLRFHPARFDCRA